MPKNKTIIIVETLLDLANQSLASARSAIYIRCDMNLELSTEIEKIMVDQGWIVATSNTIRITDKGIALVVTHGDE